MKHFSAVLVVCAAFGRSIQAAQSRIGQLLAKAEELDAGGRTAKCLEVVREMKEITQMP